MNRLALSRVHATRGIRVETGRTFLTMTAKGEGA